jgi:hypothetical protein
MRGISRRPEVQAEAGEKRDQDWQIELERRRAVEAAAIAELDQPMPAHTGIQPDSDSVWKGASSTTTKGEA